MCSLVQQNANLCHVSFKNIRLTAVAYASLAQLHHLSQITLIPPTLIIRERRVITDGTLTLLRGASRNVIHKLRVDLTALDVGQVTGEVDLMAQERCTTFKAKGHVSISGDITRNTMKYEIHA